MVKLFLKQGVTWTGNLEETGDVENKLDKITDPDGTQIYLIVFLKKDSTRSAKTPFLGRPRNLRANSVFMLFCKSVVYTG